MLSGEHASTDQYLEFDQCIRLYAVPLEPSLIHKVAGRTRVHSNDVLNICLYNPSIDVHLTEIKELCMKGGRARNVFVVILPPFQHFARILADSTYARARTAKDTHFVTTLSDYEMLLLHVQSLAHILFVLPVAAHDLQNLTTSALWRSSEQILGASHCIVPPRQLFSPT